MNRLGSVLFWMILPCAVVLPHNEANASAKDAHISRLFHRLKHLPRGATPYPIVKSAVVKVAKIDPRNSLKYFYFATRSLAIDQTVQIDNTYLSYVYLLKKPIFKVLGHADLSNDEKGEIALRIELLVSNISDSMYFGAGPGY